MSEKHTPGPWIANHGGNISRIWGPGSAPANYPVAVCSRIEATVDRHNADAQLIAASPTLLSACQAVVRLPGLAMNRATRAAARQCLAAITQAGLPPDPLAAALDACDGELEL